MINFVYVQFDCVDCFLFEEFYWNAMNKTMICEVYGFVGALSVINNSEYALFLCQDREIADLSHTHFLLVVYMFEWKMSIAIFFIAFY